MATSVVEAIFDVRRAQRRTLFRVPLAFLIEPIALDAQLLRQRIFDTRRALRRCQLLAELLGAFAPALEHALGVLQLELRRALQGLRLLEPRGQLAEQLIELRELDLVARDMGLNLGDLSFGAVEILGLALDQLLAVLNGLLEARDLRADAVVLGLHGIEPLTAVGELDAELLDRRLGRALRRDRGLERELSLGELPLLIAHLSAQRGKPKREQLGADASLLALERLVFLRVLGLLLEVHELLVDLLAQVRQAGEVVARMLDPVLRLAAPLLVFGDSGRLLQEASHVLRLRLDEPRDHSLLDDRVTAMPAKTRAEEDLRDVFAPATAVVQVVLRSAIAGDGPPHGDLGVARVRAL